MGGPLGGVRVVEIASIGPGPWCARMLSDMGAEVVRVDRADQARADDGGVQYELFNLRGRRSVALDLKQPAGVEAALRLVDRADVLLEGFRPGVAERLGVGPADCHARNPRLVYGRMTGWGGQGPLATAPGHDLTYLAVSGMLHAIGPADGPPMPPLNLVGDYGGGGMLLAFGVVAGLVEAGRSGRGQVVDAAMVDGVNLLGGLVHTLHQLGLWHDRREANELDGGAPFYTTYRTADDQWVAVAAIEPRFYAVLVEALGLRIEELPPHREEASWATLRARFAEVFATRTRREWVDRLQHLETCFAPVLSLKEAADHEHAVIRGAFVEVDGVRQAAPAPRFGRTPGEVTRGAARAGQHTDEALRDWGFSEDEISDLVSRGAAARNGKDQRS